LYVATFSPSAPKPLPPVTTNKQQTVIPRTKSIFSLLIAALSK